MKKGLTLLAGLIVLVSCSDHRAEDESPVVYSADQGPSIADTARFISNFASVYEDSMERDRPELSSEHPCIITFINKSGGWVIDFRLLNPESIRVQKDPALIWVSTTNSEKTITFKRLEIVPAEFRPGGAVFNYRKLAVPSAVVAMAEEFDPREYMEEDMKLDSINFKAHLGAEEKLPKVRDALAYLIRKCGGKKDLF